MTDKKDIRVFKRNGLKCECRVIWTVTFNKKKIYLVETPAGETWVFEDEFTEEAI